MLNPYIEVKIYLCYGGMNMWKEIKYFVIGLCTGLAYVILFTIMRMNIPNRLVVILLETVIIIALIAILSKKKYISTEKGKSKKLLFFSILAGIGGAYFHSFTVLIPIPEELVSQAVTTFQLEDYLEMCLLLPIVEELIFRGMILKYFRLNYSLKSSIILSAVIFGILHGGILQIPIAFVIGLLLAYIIFLTDELIYSILVHITINSWNIAVKGSNSLIRILSIEVPVVLCGILIGIFGAMIMLYSVNKFKKYS